VTTTDPVGAPVAGETGATVTATLTLCPAIEGSGASEVIAVVVFARAVTEVVALPAVWTDDPE
jgi:hypothetical protein